MHERQPFPILESFPIDYVEMSNAINARMVERQGQIDSLIKLQNQDREALGQIREAGRVQQKQQKRFRP